MNVISPDTWYRPQKKRKNTVYTESLGSSKPATRERQKQREESLPRQKKKKRQATLQQCTRHRRRRCAIFHHFNNPPASLPFPPPPIPPPPARCKKWTHRTPEKNGVLKSTPHDVGYSPRSTDQPYPVPYRIPYPAVPYPSSNPPPPAGFRHAAAAATYRFQTSTRYGSTASPVARWSVPTRPRDKRKIP